MKTSARSINLGKLSTGVPNQEGWVMVMVVGVFSTWKSTMDGIAY